MRASPRLAGAGLRAEWGWRATGPKLERFEVARRCRARSVPVPSWSCRTRAPRCRGGAVGHARHWAEVALSEVRQEPELELSDTRAPWARAGAVRRARPSGRAGAFGRGRAPRAELELSDARAPRARARAVRRARPSGPSWSCLGARDGAELALWTRGRHGAELELSDAGPSGPSWSCRTRAPRCRAGVVRRAHHRAELELSTRAPPGPSWSCPTRAPPGPSWSCRMRAPGCRAGAVGRGRLGPELELSEAGTTGPELGKCSPCPVVEHPDGQLRSTRSGNDAENSDAVSVWRAPQARQALPLLVSYQTGHGNPLQRRRSCSMARW
jgi:hypothetical protein